MGAKRTKSPFQVGAVVRVVRPLFVRRVGYPMAVHEEAARVARDNGGEIDAFLRSFGVNPNVEPYYRFQDTDEPPKVQAVAEIAKALAYELCRKAKWGGRERSIHTVEVAQLAGREFDVRGVRHQQISRIVRGERRPRQGGPTSLEDHRYIASERHPGTGRFVRQFPQPAGAAP